MKGVIIKFSENRGESILEKQRMLVDEGKIRIKELEEKLRTLIKGGQVGVPKTMANMHS